MTKPMQPFNLGNIIAQADQIQGQRLNNQIAQSKLSQLNAPPAQWSPYQQVPGLPKGMYSRHQVGRPNSWEKPIDLTDQFGGRDRNNNASAKTEIFPNGTVMTVRPDNSISVFDPQGMEIKDPVAKQKTVEAAYEYKQSLKDADARREVEKTEKSEAAKLRARRYQEILSQYGDQGRQAHAKKMKLMQALKLSTVADQGRIAQAKVALSRMFPDIDVSNEAALSSALTQLTMAELANFKGPTTDFEFGVAQSIPGSLGDSKAANQAKLKMLERMNWFERKEVEQFRKWYADKKNPEDFAFDYNEVMQTKKGNYKLMDLWTVAAERHISMEDLLRQLNGN